VLFPSWS